MGKVSQEWQVTRLLAKCGHLDGIASLSYSDWSRLQRDYLDDHDTNWKLCILKRYLTSYSVRVSVLATALRAQVWRLRTRTAGSHEGLNQRHQTDEDALGCILVDHFWGPRLQLDHQRVFTFPLRFVSIGFHSNLLLLLRWLLRHVLLALPFGAKYEAASEVNRRRLAVRQPIYQSALDLSLYNRRSLNHLDSCMLGARGSRVWRSHECPLFNHPAGHMCNPNHDFAATRALQYAAWRR